jgi:hypothetical protein
LERDDSCWEQFQGVEEKTGASDWLPLLESSSLSQHTLRSDDEVPCGVFLGLRLLSRLLETGSFRLLLFFACKESFGRVILGLGTLLHVDHFDLLQTRLF